MLTTELEGSDHNIASGLRHAWHHLQLNCQDVATPLQLLTDAPKYLLTQPVSNAGIYHDGSAPKSATHAITIELEKARMMKLGTTITSTHPHDHYERLAWDSWQKMSVIPLHSPPDHIGYQDNDLFRMTIARYLVGQKCPIIAPLTGRFFGKNSTSIKGVLRHWFLFLGFVPISTVLLRDFRPPFFEPVSALPFPIPRT